MPIKLKFPRTIFSWNDWGGEWSFKKGDPSKILVKFLYFSFETRFRISRSIANPKSGF